MNRRKFLQISGITTAGLLIPLKSIEAGNAADIIIKPIGFDIMVVLRATTNNGQLHFSLPCKKLIKGDILSYSTLDSITITAIREFKLLKLEAQLPQELIDTFKSIGLNKEWLVLGIPYSPIIYVGESITIEFPKEVFTIS